MNQPFSLFQLTESHLDNNGKLFGDNPVHSHDYEELIIGIEGEVEHFIDYKTIKLTAPFISFVTSGKIHRVTPATINGKCTIWGLRFKSDFISETTFHLYSYYHDHASVQIQSDFCSKRIISIVEIMFEETKQNNVNYVLVRHLLNAIFTIIESERKKALLDSITMQHTQNDNFKKFLILLEKNFNKHEGVEFYADQLFMTGRNLNLICHTILQKSVSEIIEHRKLIEAKNLLINSEKSISEIGYEVGYNENTHFTNVFKKKSGQTPSEFRSEMRKLIS